MRIVVTGGAGFIGSHLCDRLIARGDEVVCVDDLSSGRPDNIAGLLGSERFTFLDQDIIEGLDVAGPVDAVMHLASPASPPDYRRRPLETLAVGSRGTENALRLAHRHGARFVLASTSEVYGDPVVHPQREDYWGNVNPIGPRSVYDEAKRYAEAVTSAYRRTLGVDTGIVRIFNTYGPRMRADDGRVVSSFLVQALSGEPLTIYGDGSQTRSFCYVDDLVTALVAMMESDQAGPINCGNPAERTIAELATLVGEITGCPVVTEHHELPQDDPTRRRPDIGRAQALLGWSPQVEIEDGLRSTAAWFASRPEEVASAAADLRGGQLDEESRVGDDLRAVPALAG
ncbi:UDP-glucuronic acid decarboxylase family protein [Streptacidiphilus jiangxiensis]|uniref:dTDP-glucose 4,6-dehydratase n=1 Tax=Streptacidiphilus jiangxiensis TaxID=235985 RepID=A0A1H7L8C3_STRJI|nr:UDP-glucuronic acid decarboxylase family protein [Streptacidiphilus jiangxiensis]SEK94507.1 dTDP-glucose 4,6-dehydratase [Streptacidiphilus jiangxiensis]